MVTEDQRVVEPDLGSFQCPRCPRMLNSKQGLGKHVAWHERMNRAEALGIEARKVYPRLSSSPWKTNPINEYLKRLSEPKQKLGTRLSVDQLNEKISEAFNNGNFLRAVELTTLRQKKEADEPEKLEEYFIEHAAEYSESRGITAAAWQELGVPVRVIKEAGIK